MEEYGRDADIRAFAARMRFPFGGGGYLMKLGSVKGDAAPPVWKHLRDATGSSDPRWNFSGAYLVSKSGTVRLPTDGKRSIEADIEALLLE